MRTGSISQKAEVEIKNHLSLVAKTFSLISDGGDNHDDDVEGNNDGDFVDDEADYNNDGGDDASMTMVVVWEEEINELEWKIRMKDLEGGETVQT